MTFFKPPFFKGMFKGMRQLTLGGLKYLLQDEFTTDRASGAVNGTLAEPGPGTRTTSAAMSISGGVLQLPANTNIKWNDVSISRLTGQSVIVNLNFNNNLIQGGFASAFIRIQQSAGRAFFLNDGSGIKPSGNLGAGLCGSDTAALVLRNPGAFGFSRFAGPIWKLMYLVAASSVAPGVPTITAGSVFTKTADYIRVPKATFLPTATQTLSGAQSAGQTFTHKKDFLLEATITALPTAGQIEIRFRAQDALNYWRLTIDSSGNLDLDEVAAGIPTQRGTAAAIVAAGHRIVMWTDDIIIRVHSNDVVRFQYASAANFKTETDGELETLGTGGAVSDIITWPRGTEAEYAVLEDW